MLRISARRTRDRFNGKHRIAGSDYSVGRFRPGDENWTNNLAICMADNDVGQRELLFGPLTDSALITHEVMEAIKLGNYLNVSHAELSTIAVGFAEFLREVGIELVIKGDIID